MVLAVMFKGRYCYTSCDNSAVTAIFVPIELRHIRDDFCMQGIQMNVANEVLEIDILLADDRLDLPR